MTEQSNRVFLLSLGCSKNTVDSERLMAQAEAAGVVFTESASDAETIIINTCGFIADAKEESINETLAAITEKESGRVRKIFVMGCLPELYRSELQTELPEVDGFFGTRELPAVLTAIGARYRSELHLHRSLTAPGHTSFLKISEGCSRSCSFCSIPRIRGPYISQPLDQLLREARLLQEKGVQELNIIAQDITLYGVDLYGRQMLNDLLLRLSDMEFHWIRLLYAYPLNFPLEVIETMSQRGNICNYLDLPLQHCNDRILHSMNRGITKEGELALIEAIRQKNPDIRLRTTMIAGYPGETRQEFEELLEFAATVRFDRLGCFSYCHEEFSPAFALEDSVPEEEKQSRTAELMELQEGISEEKNKRLEGREIAVCIDRIEENTAWGRTEWDAPEVDNECSLEGAGHTIAPGSFCLARIDGSSPYELFGTVLKVLE
ncbi:30S ribosomal protein S12 methylthiotransferase RimO [Chlorobium phaeovibrioides]|uniref:30S ribosomal protein S12 methylthiotransferase RimO n=1 Tax=Chlorobium phaeovibrioides TaxID=1094 RepID=UPI001230975E|nr:30S ribosomal protein S12 methylthiotransferase RimO [Chlorobium phaeovibrioides]QEQ56722.1 30S ribosomal protein S12 methylthiotransferase RimO [Chlorobium phaeovibrioides]